MSLRQPFESKQAFMEATLPMYPDYQPAPEVTAHTRRVDLTTVTGPAGVGKNTVMTGTGLPIVVSETTRDPRENDGVMEQHGVEYYFRGGELEVVHADIATGQYVQWAPGPNDNIYGSRNEAYPAEGPALIDVVARAVPDIRKLGKNFHTVESAYVVAESFDAWMQRFKGRGEIKPEDFHSRLEEAHSSLEFGLDDEEMHFILNRDKDEAAKNLRLLAERHEDFAVEAVAKNCGHAILRGLSAELGRPITYSVS